MFPLGFMLYFGDPNWYEKYVLPVRAATWHPVPRTLHATRDRFCTWPRALTQKQPRTKEELQQLLQEKREQASVAHDPAAVGLVSYLQKVDKERMI